MRTVPRRKALQTSIPTGSPVFFFFPMLGAQLCCRQISRASLRPRLNICRRVSSTTCIAARFVRLVTRTEPCLLEGRYLDKCCWRAPPPAGDRTVASSALSSTSSHRPFFASRSQSCTSSNMSTCGSLRPRILTWSAISRKLCSSRAVLLACAQNTHVSGDWSAMR